MLKLKDWYSTLGAVGNVTPYQRDFRRGADIIGVQKTLAHFVLQ
ncbi:MAG: hypothetical protein P8Z00_03315 [Anaerolineales bacterium]